MESNEITEQCKFFERKQLAGESFDEFCDDLKGIARDCGFGEIEEKMLKCQIVRGIANEALKTLFLQENPDLQDIILRCQEAEVDKFQDLPDELIVRIMSYLPLEDRKKTRLVCKRWHAISYTKSLVKHDWTVAYGLDDFEVFKFPTRHSNVRVNYCDDNYYGVEFWRTHGQDIQAINLTKLGKNMSASNLSAILQHCPNLKEMSLWDVSSIPGDEKEENETDNANLEHRSCSPVRLEHLTTLRLRFSKLLPKLVIEELDQILDAPNLSQIYVHCREADESLAELITRRSSSIKEVELKQIGVSLDFVVESFGSGLTKLIGIEMAELTLIGRKFPNLRQLGISTFGLEWSELAQTLRQLTNLTHISLCGTLLTGPVDYTFFHSKQMDQVVAIDLRLGTFYDDTYMAVFSTLRPNLVDVRLNGHEILDQILPNVPNLQVLELGRLIDEEDVRAIASHSKKLKFLDLSHTDISQCPSLNAIESLERLALGYPSGGIDMLHQLCLPKLEMIDVNFVRDHITIQVVDYSLRRPDDDDLLQQFLLRESKNFVSDKLTVQDINGLVERCPKLYEMTENQKNLCDVSAVIARRRPSRRVEDKFDFWSAVRSDE